MELLSNTLPAELAAILDREQRDALDHPLRREILRCLIRRGQACAPADLMARLRPFRLGQVNYHLQVLAGAGAVIQGAVGSALGGGVYLPNAADEPEVTAVLWATEREDREFREAVLEDEGRRPEVGG